MAIVDGDRKSRKSGWMMHRYRSHTCGELRATDVDSNVRLSGWLHNRRDLGGVVFRPRETLGWKKPTEVLNKLLIEASGAPTT
jgi:hypothetical protein